MDYALITCQEKPIKSTTEGESTAAEVYLRRGRMTLCRIKTSGVSHFSSGNRLQ